jgi:hypothetical protein
MLPIQPLPPAHAPSSTNYQLSTNHHQLSPVSPWPCLETLPGLIALPRVWQARLDGMFERVKVLILQENLTLAQLLPCPRGCGLAHDIISRPDGSLVATCGGDPSRPLEILLTPADITPLEMSWTRLGRALCHALGLDSRFGKLQPPNTIQFGAWSADGVPAVLTIQAYPGAFRGVVAELVAELGRPFMLFAPTSRHLDVPSLGYLTSARAAFFPLDSTVLLTGDGRLCPAKNPGELFAHFTPQPKEVDQDVARKVMGIVSALDVGDPPTPLRVFRLYCIEGLSIAQVAEELDFSPATICRRLQAIRAATGTDPKDLRRLSSYFTGSTDQVSD